MEHENKQRIPYWKWVPTAFALSGIIVLIFATYGPPASSSGFVSTLKGFFEWAVPEYAAAKVHYKAIPAPDRGSSPLCWAWPSVALSPDGHPKKSRCAICRPSGSSDSATAG